MCKVKRCIGRRRTTADSCCWMAKIIGLFSTTARVCSRGKALLGSPNILMRSRRFGSLHFPFPLSEDVRTMPFETGLTLSEPGSPTRSKKASTPHPASWYENAVPVHWRNLHGVSRHEPKYPSADRRTALLPLACVVLALFARSPTPGGDLCRRLHRRRRGRQHRGRNLRGRTRAMHVARGDPAGKCVGGH